MLKVLSLFSGIGAFEKALTNLKIPFELVNYCEIDKYASKSYAAIHNVSEALNLADVRKVNTSSISNVDLITYGFPCVPKGSKIKTTNGYKNIEDIDTFDYVLTHENKWRQVRKIMHRTSDHINIIKGQGCYDLRITDEHPIYVLRDGTFQWIKAKDLEHTDMLCYNINQFNEHTTYADNVLWLLGRYFADGWRNKKCLRHIFFSIGRNKVAEFEEKTKGLTFRKYDYNRGAVIYRLTDPKCINLFEYLTTGALYKEIPEYVINLCKEQLQVFFDGYICGDGHICQDIDTVMFTTVSEKMALNLQDIVIKLYGVVPTITKRVDNRKESYNDTYNGKFCLHVKHKIIGDKICTPVKKITRVEESTEVFNLEVDADNSYTVNNVIVHNCQDISAAGKQRGFTDENGECTRSGLFFEAYRIISDVLPKYAIAENVKALVSKKFKNEFQLILDSLSSIGYNNYYDVLNAKDYGVPQNRERVFIVSIRKDIDDGSFSFPSKQELTIRLKDILEDDVEEKYYISSDRVKDMLEKNLKDKGINIVGHTKSGGEKSDIMSVDGGGISSYLSATDYKQPKQIVEPNAIQVVGNYSPSNHDASRIVDTDGIAPTVKENHGTVTAIVEDE